MFSFCADRPDTRSCCGYFHFYVSHRLINKTMNTYKEVDDAFIDAYRSKFNLLIVTATKIEKEILHAHLQPLPGLDQILQIHSSKYTYYLGIFGIYYTIHVACNEMGSAGRNSSILTTSHAITTWSPTVVLMVGIAFGIDREKQKIGDVLVSESVQAYEAQRIGETNTVFRGKQGPASSLLLDRFKSVNDWDFKFEDGKTPEIISGPILSGEKLIDNAEFKADLMKIYPEAKGGEMEGAGLYAACDQTQADWILVKGICDFADGNKGKDKEKNQKMAMEGAVALCELVFSKNFAFKDVSLIIQDDVLKTDFSEEKGAIPEWMKKKAKALGKEIHNED